MQQKGVAFGGKLKTVKKSNEGKLQE